jgi:hypothetical protein
MTDMVDSLIEVQLSGNNEHEINVSFNRVKDVLTRIGVATKDRSLIQSVHILKKKNKYYIVHFKQMFGLDGREFEMTAEDTQRLIRVVRLLEDWELLKTIKDVDIDRKLDEFSKVMVIKRSDVFKGNLSEEVPDGMYRLKRKYSIGNKSHIQQRR